MIDLAPANDATWIILILVEILVVLFIDRSASCVKEYIRAKYAWRKP